MIYARRNANASFEQLVHQAWYLTTPDLAHYGVSATASSLPLRLQAEYRTACETRLIVVGKQLSLTSPQLLDGNLWYELMQEVIQCQ